MAGTSDKAAAANPRISTDAERLLDFVTGVDRAGSPVASSFWSYASSINGDAETAHKWGGGPAGSAGGTILYAFDAHAGWTDSERTMFKAVLALWSATANVRFAEATSGQSAVVIFYRGGPGAESATSYSQGGASMIARTDAGITVINTAIPCWNRLDSLDARGGYGVTTLVHEIGHLLGLGHSGAYNGAADPETQQLNACDTRQWSTMSYINPFPDNTGQGAFVAGYPVKGTDWGRSADGYVREPTTWMPLDILAAQRLYGAPADTPLSGGQTFGFHCTVPGLIARFFDFAVNAHPVVTLWSAGSGNTLDLSGFAALSVVDLRPGTFSSAAGMTNNIGIGYGVSVDAVVGGAGDDSFTVNAAPDTIDGGAGADTVIFTEGGSRYVISGNGDVRIDHGGVVDTLRNVETLSFAGGADTVTFANPGLLCGVRQQGRRVDFGSGQAELAVGDRVAFTGGAATIGADGGSLLLAGGHNVLFLGASAADVALGGNDTLIGGAGAVTSRSLGSGATAGNLVFDTAGPLAYAAAGGADTVVATAATVTGGSGNITVFGGGGGPAGSAIVYYGGSGQATVASGLGAETVYGGLGGGLIVGGTIGRNVLVADGGAEIIYANSDGDTVGLTNASGNVVVLRGGAHTVLGTAATGSNQIYAGPGADRIMCGSGNDVIAAGSGAATLTGGGGCDLYEFVAGHCGGSDTITDWNAAADAVVLIGYGAAGAATVRQAAAVASDSVTMLLPDHTKLVFLDTHVIPSLLSI